jgi:hypothetical protein
MNYTEIPGKETVERTAVAIKARNIEPIIVATKEEALAKIKELVPAGASVMNGTSRTLEEIGYIEYLKGGTHGWNNLHGGIVQEKDPAKQAELRNKALFAEYYLGSVHAVSANGELVIASNSSSQLPHIVYTSKNIIFVASTQKIAPDLDAAYTRLREHVYPLEDARMKSTGASGSRISKILTFEYEPEFMGRAVRIILVNEKLGF